MKVSIDTGERGEITAPGRIGTNAAVAIRTDVADGVVCDVFLQDGFVTELRVRTHDGGTRVITRKEIDDV